MSRSTRRGERWFDGSKRRLASLHVGLCIAYSALWSATVVVGFTAERAVATGARFELRPAAFSWTMFTGVLLYAGVGGERWLLRMSLGELEHELPGQRFWRIHRSHLVAADAVKSFRSHDDERRLVVVLSDGTEIVASRAASRRLRDLIA